MIVLLLVAGALVGGAIGGLARRRRGPEGGRPRRASDTSSFGAHAGFPNQGS